MNAPKKMDAAPIETTGHEWDGIRELNNPLPRWWLWVFLITILWAIGYWILMPAWPMVSDYSRGMLGYSQRAKVADDIVKAKAAQGIKLKQLADLPLAAIPTDPELMAFAIGGGRSAFAVNCSPCHGTGAAGSKGYPNLNDDDWLWGGKISDIERTIRYGIRSGHAEARVNDMPAFAQINMLTATQASDVADYVLSLSGTKADAAAIKRGQSVFADNCVACHGEDAKGKRELGAPNLTDAIWLYGGDKASVVASITEGRRGVMPAWEGRLDNVTIKELAVFVHSLGGGQ
jgi:cytochrome c oxidase cbb3-type subunit III